MELKSNPESCLLEIAVSIGTSIGTDFSDQVLPLVIERLSCKEALIVNCNDQTARLVAVTKLPLNRQHLLIQQSKDLYKGFSLNELFITVRLENSEYTAYRLADFGLLFLCYQDAPSSERTQMLQPVLIQLAHSLIITEKLTRLTAENTESLRKSALLHAIIENIPDPVYVKDLEGRKILLNQAEADILGVADFRDCVGKKDNDFYPEEVALKTDVEDRMIIETGNPVLHKEGVLTTLGGQKIWVQGTKIPFLDENGNVTGIIGISHNISEYKKIENELRFVADKYQSIFNSFVDLYYRSDLQGTILELSPSVYQLSGYKPEELIGKSVSAVYSDAKSRDRMIQLLVEKGSVNDYENLFVNKNGKLVPVSITSHFVKDSEGKPGYIEGTIREITERKEAEEKIGKMMNLQNLLTQIATEFINMPIGNSDDAVDKLLSVIGKGNDIERVYIFEYDFSKNTMSNSHEWCAEGISPEKDKLQQIPTEKFPSWVNAHLKGEMLVVEDVSMLETNDPLYLVLAPQGIKSLITLPLVLHGDCIGFVGFDSVKNVKSWSTDEITFLQILADLLCNINDRKRTDEALQNREAYLKAIFNNAPYQMWLKDIDSRYLAVNQPFIDYFSIASESDILGKTASDIWSSDIADHFIAQDELVMHNLESISVEEFIDFKHKTAWFELFRAPIIDQNGNLLGTTGIARDITNRKNTDKALQQAVEAAESANNAKSRFLAIMSHEIRNPLNAVVGMVRMLNEAGITGPNGILIDNIKSSSDQLLTIINDILDISKIESGEMVLEVTSFNIREVLKRVFDSNIYFARENQIELNLDIDKRIGPLHKGDSLRLQQVIANLTSNALKFTPKGKIDIRAHFEGQTGPNIRIRFEVEDTGIGISEENQEKIFESYKQENDTISRTHGGSGLGLAISKQIVELMGGKLCIESVKNKGSRFYFSIILQTTEDQSNQKSANNMDTEYKSLVGYSLLLVEDNKLNQILATAMLKNWGARVVVAGNGQIALDILGRESFDIILMDIQMPVMDGMTASRLIRENLKLTIPILALSANVLKGVEEKCKEAGMQGYISKPYEADDLYRKIVNSIAQSKQKPEIDDDISSDTIIADVTRLRNMIGSDPSELKKMILKFLEITPAYADELNTADSANDLNAIALASHKIKSSIDLVSTQVLRDLITKINFSSKADGNLNELKNLIAKFNKYYKILEEQLIKMTEN
ncbi:MAG: PAS domain S-box protein [Bacteroidota bacterium]